jgi:hypothetical protein
VSLPCCVVVAWYEMVTCCVSEEEVTLALKATEVTWYGDPSLHTSGVGGAIWYALVGSDGYVAPVVMTITSAGELEPTVMVAPVDGQYSSNWQVAATPSRKGVITTPTTDACQPQLKPSPAPALTVCGMGPAPLRWTCAGTQLGDGVGVMVAATSAGGSQLPAANVGGEKAVPLSSPCMLVVA